MKQQVDVLINGGGMVGLAFAALLPEELSIGIVELNPGSSITQLDEQIDHRVSALSRQSEEMLKRIGCWKKIPSTRLSAYQRMEVWEHNGTSKLTFTAQELATQNLGHIVENSIIRAALMDRLAEQSNITWMNCPMVAIESDSDLICATFEDNRQCYAKLLVGADGVHSKVRELAGIAVDQKNYFQQALVATIATEKSHQFTAWQRFLETGPIAYLPLVDEKLSSIVWSLQEDKAADVLSLSKEQQQSLIANALGYELGAIELQSELQSFPLVARHAETYIKDRVALIGDAAHSIHPLAGQGVNLGFKDAEQLAQRVSLAAKTSIDKVGAFAMLRRYERARKADNHMTQKAMTALNWIYSQPSLPMTMIRNLGVSLLQQSPSIKRRLAKQAMGLSAIG